MLVYKVKSLRNSPLCSSVARTGTWDGSEDRMWKEESRNTAWTCMGALKKAENELKLRCASNVKGNENSFYIATLTTEDEQWNQLIQAWIRSRYLIPPVLVFPNKVSQGFISEEFKEERHWQLIVCKQWKTWQIWCMWWCQEPAGDTESLPFGTAWRLAKVPNNREKNPKPTLVFKKWQADRIVSLSFAPGKTTEEVLLKATSRHMDQKHKSLDLIHNSSVPTVCCLFYLGATLRDAWTNLRLDWRNRPAGIPWHTKWTNAKFCF